MEGISETINTSYELSRRIVNIDLDMRKSFIKLIYKYMNVEQKRTREDFLSYVNTMDKTSVHFHDLEKNQ